MRASHYNGTATTTPAKVALKRPPGQSIRIRNLDTTNNLLVSFDGGTNFATIKPTDQPIVLDVLFHYFYVQSSASTVAYDALVSEG
jgi:hypothetical protein